MLRLRQVIPREYCLGCFGCCRFNCLESAWTPKLLNEEKERIVFAAKQIRVVSGPGKDDFICEFLSLRDNKCHVYHSRPFECQLYPFLINRNGKNVFLSLDLKCPFAKENLEYNNFKEYIQYLTSLFKSQSGKDLLKSNPQLIQAYDDTLDLVILEI
ncbi:MAG: YkgJ family cysteine cluster protein [Candidatus Omnitrophica bacterium]|nr:YkgJ family cysteine cluster protein [Candidatus Omnitrophota bacterium]